MLIKTARPNDYSDELTEKDYILSAYCKNKKHKLYYKGDMLKLTDLVSNKEYTFNRRVRGYTVYVTRQIKKNWKERII